jgi:isopropylmalate/homocitrate/citramalate synthase
MLASASDHHIFDKLKYPSKEAAIEKYLIPIMTALENGIRPRVHLEDATKADISGWVIPFMKRVMEETRGRACFRVCDTMGWGAPDPHVGLPTGIPKLISVLYEETGAELEFHGHNDFGLATANSIAAWIYGCNRVNTAFAGMGERTGNTSLEQMVAAMVRLYGNPGLNLGLLAEITKLIHTEVHPVSTKAPLIGGSIFTTQAGLHQTGVQRHKEAPGGLIYLPYSPGLVGEQVESINRRTHGHGGRRGFSIRRWRPGEKDAYDGQQNSKADL